MQHWKACANSAAVKRNSELEQDFTARRSKCCSRFVRMDCCELDMPRIRLRLLTVAISVSKPANGKCNNIFVCRPYGLRCVRVTRYLQFHVMLSIQGFTCHDSLTTRSSTAMA